MATEPMARRTDPTRCPKHGGAVINHLHAPNGAPTVEVNGLGAACVGDIAERCGGVVNDFITQGAATVIIGHRPVARVGSTLSHAGATSVVAAGSPNVVVGGPLTQPGEELDAAIARAKKNLACAKNRLTRWNADDQAQFRTWFGTTDEVARAEVMRRVDTAQSWLGSVGTPNSIIHFDFAEGDVPDMRDFGYVSANDTNESAHVHPNDPNHNIYMNSMFFYANLKGMENRAGTLVHEISHFDAAGQTEDYARPGTVDRVYGAENSQALAREDPDGAMRNADNFANYTTDVQKTCP